MINPDYFQHYECTYTVTDVDTGKIIHKDIIVAPRLIHEQQFLSLVQEASKIKRRLKVMISRYKYVDGRDDPLLLDITYQNY